MERLINPYADKATTITEENINFVEGDEFYICGGFDFTITKYVLPKLVAAVQNASNMRDAVIRIYIDSNGGYIHVLQNLLGLIEVAKAQGTIVETHVFSYAFSCGSILAASGSKGHRYCSPFAEHLPHLGATGSGMVINDTEAERMGARMKAHFDFVRNCYLRYANIKDLDKVIHDDCYFIRGADIVKNGLADHLIFELPKIEKAKEVKKNVSKKVSGGSTRKRVRKKS